MKPDSSILKKEKKVKKDQQASQRCYWDWLEDAEKASFMAWNKSRKN